MMRSRPANSDYRKQINQLFMAVRDHRRCVDLDESHFYVSSLSQESASDTIRLGNFGSYVAHFGVYAVLATLLSLSIWGWKCG